MARGDLRSFIWGWVGGVGGLAPPPPSWGALGVGKGPGAELGCLLASLVCTLFTFFFYIKKTVILSFPTSPPPAPWPFLPITPQAPYKEGGLGNARGWRAGWGEHDGWLWESQGGWLGAPGAGTPRSGLRYCSDCEIFRNLGEGSRKRGEERGGVQTGTPEPGRKVRERHTESRDRHRETKTDR